MNTKLFAFLGLTFVAGCSASSSFTGPSQSQVDSLNFLASNGHITAKTVILGKGDASEASCRGRLCSAFGVESVSSDVDIEYMLEVDLALVDESQPLVDNPRPIYVLVDHRLKHTIRQSGRTRVEDKTLRREGAISCANEPYMYVLLPQNGYTVRSGGTAEVTVKRTYAPGSAVASFETTNVEGADSPIVRVSLEPFRAGRHDSWHRDFSSFRP